MVEEYVVGIDLGGTKILTAMADLEGRLLATTKLPTKPMDGVEAVIQRMVESVNQVLSDVGISPSEVINVGVGCPGPLNTESGLIYFAPNLGWREVNLKQLLESELELEVIIENDANAAALGSKWFGVGQDYSDLIYLTVSTGIGSGIIINDQLYHGANDSAGEVGHMIVDPRSDVECNCGNRGCWEVLASGTALARLGRKAAQRDSTSLLNRLVDDVTQIDGAVVTQAARQGDDVACKIVEQVVDYLSIGVANLINLLNPDLIVCGGGVLAAKELILPPLRSKVATRVVSTERQAVQLVSTELGSEIGVRGAIAKALLKNNRLQ
ncbi:MAG: ROK family protein [Bacillota bacterium]